MANVLSTAASLGQIGLGFLSNWNAPDNPYTSNNPQALYAAYAQSAAAQAEAANQVKEADLLKAESEQAAAQKEREGNKFRAEQANAYNASGVTLEGSPLLVLNETRALAQQEVDAIRRRGGAQSDLMKRRAVMTANQGRASFLGFESQLNADKLAYDNEVSRIRKSGFQNALSSGLDALSGPLGNMIESWF